MSDAIRALVNESHHFAGVPLDNGNTKLISASSLMWEDPKLAWEQWEEKTQNTAISKQRITVEHSIGGVKVSAITGQVFRNLKASFDDLVMETTCGLHNLRLDFPMTK